VIELHERRLLRLREEAQPLFENALQHVLEDELAVDDFHHPIERLELARLRADLFRSREHEIFEHPVLPLEVAQTEPVDDISAETDHDDICEERPPAK